MTTEIVKQINIKLDKNDKESIEKVIPLVNELINTGDKYKNDGYNINDAYYSIVELDTFMEFLKNLIYTEVIELT